MKMRNGHAGKKDEIELNSERYMNSKSKFGIRRQANTVPTRPTSPQRCKGDAVDVKLCKIINDILETFMGMFQS